MQTARLSKGGIVRTSAQIGSVHPYEDADLYAKISGYLANLHVDYGDHVKRDQLLAEIDDPEVVEDEKKAAADVLQAKAAVTQAEAFIESAKADREAQASAVEQAVAEVDRYKYMRIYHEKKFARYKELVISKAIPQQIADEEEEGYESARSAEIASQKAVLNSRAQPSSPRRLASRRRRPIWPRRRRTSRWPRQSMPGRPCWSGIPRSGLPTTA